MTSHREKDRSESLWEEIKLQNYPGLNKNIQTEVCIVGGGIAGISVAYQLAKRGHKVVVLEGSKISSGQSGRTTAHLTYQLEQPLDQMIKHHDEDQLAQLMGSHQKAIDVIEETIYQENISCDFKRLDGYLFLGAQDIRKTLEEEVRLGQKLGFDLKIVETVPGFAEFGPAVIYPDQAQFHPLKYMSGLLRVMNELDVDIYENSHVEEFSSTDHIHEVVTRTGFKVSAKYLVVATDSPVNNRFHIHTQQSAYRTYVVAFDIKNRSFPLMWDTAEPYHYIRQSGNTLIVGGEDHRTGQAPKHDPFEAIVRWAREHFTFLGEIQHKWSGQVFEPVDGMAFIGKNPGQQKNIFIITGQSGAGMTNATIGSLVITDLIEEKSNPMIALFDPSRAAAFKDTKEFIKDLSNVAIQYKDWFTPSEVKSLTQIPVDQGSVVREGLTKACVYHAEGTGFEKKSAVCPHLGGIVHWNDVEKTWDCPCHGSRFNAHGKVIEGPSLVDLLESR